MMIIVTETRLNWKINKKACSFGRGNSDAAEDLIHILEIIYTENQSSYQINKKISNI